MGDQRVGLVLAGGGARGAYEAGVLSVLLPVLQARGQRPTVFVGTSVGGINAAYLAATAHLSAEESAAGLVSQWRQTRLAHVVRPLVYQQFPLMGARLLASVLGAPGVHVASLFDPSPIGHNLAVWNDWTALRANVDDGLVHAVAVLATAVTSDRTVVFCDCAAGIPAHRSHTLDYLPSQLAVEHVQACAAIPLLFPPVYIQHPARAAGWYLDGGLRLNTPIKPALDLGAERLVVIATSAEGRPPTAATQPTTAHLSSPTPAATTPRTGHRTWVTSR